MERYSRYYIGMCLSATAGYAGACPAFLFYKGVSVEVFLSFFILWIIVDGLYKSFR